MHRYKNVIITLVLLIFASSALIMAQFIDYHIISNDFLGFLNLSNILELKDFTTWYNGVMPPGYVILIKILGILNLNITQILVYLNIVFGIIFLLFLSFNFKNELGYWIRIFLIISIGLLDPNLTYYLLAQVPTYIFSILTSTGLLLIFTKNTKENSNPIFTGFTLLLITTLIRYHGILICLITFLLLIRYCSISQLKKLITVSIPFAIFFLTTNFLGTGNFFSTNHSLGIEKVNWFEISPYYKFENLSLVGFLKFYIQNFSEHIIYFIPFIIIQLFKFSNRKNLQTLLQFCILYYFIINLHPSPRGVIAIIPISYFIVAVIVNEIYKQYGKIILNDINRRIRLIALLSLVIVTVQFLRQTKYTWLNSEKEKIIHLNKIDSLISNNKNSEFNISHVFSNDFNYYSPMSLPKTHYFNGGWVRLSKQFYKFKPNIDFSTIESFTIDLKKRDLEILVINDKLLKVQLGVRNYEQVSNYLQSPNFILLDKIDNKYIYVYK